MQLTAMLVLGLLSAGQASGGRLTADALDFALEPPRIDTRPGDKYADENRDAGMVIGIERTPGGRLWACWVGNGDRPDGFMILATSDDDGDSWSPPRLVIDPSDRAGMPPRGMRVGNLWTDPAGRLWLFFEQTLGGFDGRSGDWYIRCDDPDADQPRWSSPVRIADGCTLNKPTVLASGAWLLPVSLWDRGKISPADFKDAHHSLDSQRMAHVYASVDEGRTWTRRGGVAFAEPAFDEHMLVELGDGRLWMLARTRLGMAESYSADQGFTWSPAAASPIRHTSARFHLRRLASGKLLLVKHGLIEEQTPKRSHLRAFLSNDDGRTWQGGLLLDERSSVSYPDGFQSPDGRIFIIYDRNRHTDGEILLARFREEDVLAGRFHTPNSGSQMLVNRPKRHAR